MINTSGDLAGYKRKQEEFLAAFRDIRSRYNRFFIAYHGDADGIISAAQVIRFLQSRPGVETAFHGYEQFRELEYENVSRYYGRGFFIILCEGYGLCDEFRTIDDRCLNIDHHPVSREISCFLNPREFSLEPLPANSLVVWELLKPEIPADYEITAAFGSIMDYCRPAAADIIERHDARFEPLTGIRDVFLAVQYVTGWTDRIVSLLLTDPQPINLIGDELLKNRRDQYRDKLDMHLEQAMNRYRDQPGRALLVHEVERDDLRIASPVATNLADRIIDRIVVVAEHDGSRSRLSVRNRGLDIDVGEVLKKICAEFPAADGIGHQKAGSARINRDDFNVFIRVLEENL